MKKTCLILCLLGLLISCSNQKPTAKLFNKDNIRTQLFSINPEVDNKLVGSRGGVFQIPKGSFDGAGKVDIEIKEVYSPAEIMYAGLVTESNGRLLESGGMIYINAKRDGKELTLLKEIDVSIPTNYINEEMQLFKGEETDGGDINWTEPEPLDFQSAPPSIDTGELIFNTSCASCHYIFKDGTGPAMAGLEQRINDRNVIKAFIKNPGGVMAENGYFRCQWKKFGSMMTAFPNLTDRELDLVLDYIKNETEKRPDLLKPKNLSSTDVYSDTINYSNCISAPCGFDTIYVDTTQYGRLAITANIFPLEATKNDSLDILYKDPEPLEAGQRKGFTDDISTTGRYNFKIKTLGWFNVDAFYEGMKGTDVVDLFVKTEDNETRIMDVHVFFPAKKLLTVGVFHIEDSLYHFEKYKGQIPLFLNDEAIAFAVTSAGEKINYGISSFKVTNKQTITVKIKETTKEALEKAIIEMNLDGIDLDIITKKRIIIPRNCGDLK